MAPAIYTLTKFDLLFIVILIIIHKVTKGMRGCMTLTSNSDNKAFTDIEQISEGSVSYTHLTLPTTPYV